ncbi:Major facilitator superfamily like protein [Aduncisulcus paluster]|uniref:Major facilitator superfamily like protein n=1 Tax=Aduncisulcus paluster TaxID=2918883 RepID=A0ABQ5KL49_9EUKA|nr:Major facilitator superfamily like protein [Aduncisulcus paluster]|eukprot:gnl/Carplike_NY0171/975_a1341_1021.p1 GENE.gnl/Carplike_NY0171/975_a1341_1021~~gnl/Carplike_NY0171/975_a1341_1021.p1  ORF type:complete len:544 (+),score=130.92 gnl/Carplike_NY0171/975_a1341_1021:28-1632(+)
MTAAPTKTQNSPFNSMPAGKLMSCLGISTVLGSLDISIVSVGLYSIAEYYGASEDITEWITLAYSLTIASGSLIAGKIGDKFGPILVHRIGMIGFIFFSCMCSIPISIFYTICMRACQGLIASLMLTNNLSLIASLCEHKGMPKAMAINTTCFSVSNAIGPLLGGLIVGICDWSWIFMFLINLPLGLIGVVLCVKYLPTLPAKPETKFDIVGAIGLLISVGGIVFGINWLENDSVIGGSAIGIGFALLALSLLWEYHCPFPVLPFGLLVNRKVICSLLGSLLIFMAQSALLYAVPYFWQQAYGLSSTTVGLMLLPVPIFIVISATFTSKFVSKYCSVYARAFGSVIQAIFFCVLALVTPISYIWMILVMCVMALGLGAFQTSAVGFVMSASPSNCRGVTGGLVQTFREVGIAAGTALSIAVQDLVVEANGFDPDAGTAIPFDVLAKGASSAFYTNAGIGALGLIPILLAAFGDHEVNLIGHPRYDPLAQPRIGTDPIEFDAKKFFGKRKADQGKTSLLDHEDDVSDSTTNSSSV